MSIGNSTPSFWTVTVASALAAALPTTAFADCSLLYARACPTISWLSQMPLQLGLGCPCFLELEGTYSAAALRAAHSRPLFDHPCSVSVQQLCEVSASIHAPRLGGPNSLQLFS